MADTIATEMSAYAFYVWGAYGFAACALMVMLFEAFRAAGRARRAAKDMDV